MAELVIETHTDDGRVTLVLRGDFDMAAIPRFERELARAEEAEPETIVIDLDGLQFMDSSGLRALVAADDRARRKNRRLSIVPGPPAVRRVFEITQLDTRLDLL